MSWLPQCTPGSMLPKLSFCHVSPLHQGGIHQPAQDLKTLSDDSKLQDKWSTYAMDACFYTLVYISYD